jgi:hypothetical protein
MRKSPMSGVAQGLVAAAGSVGFPSRGMRIRVALIVECMKRGANADEQKDRQQNVKRECMRHKSAAGN